MKVRFLFILTSCNINRSYSSSSFGAIKSYTERPLYNGEKETTTYIAGSLSNTTTSQYKHWAGLLADGNIVKENSDKSISGNFSIYRSTTAKYFNYYYGVGGGFGNYEFKSEYDIVKKEKLNFYSLNLKAGMGYSRTWKKISCNFVGWEMIYINEFGPYMDRLHDLRTHFNNSSKIIVANENSFFAYNVNSEVIFRINQNNNMGIGFYSGNVFGIDSKNIQDKTWFRGVMLKYRYKKVTFSIISQTNVVSNSFKYGLTYKIF